MARLDQTILIQLPCRIESTSEICKLPVICCVPSGTRVLCVFGAFYAYMHRVRLGKLFPIDLSPLSEIFCRHSSTAFHESPHIGQSTLLANLCFSKRRNKKGERFPAPPSANKEVCIGSGCCANDCYPSDVRNRTVAWRLVAAYLFSGLRPHYKPRTFKMSLAKLWILLAIEFVKLLQIILK